MRACAVLAIASIQNGQIKNMQKFAGMYHTLTSLEGLHDEKLWPKDLCPVETEERRRLVRKPSFYELGVRVTNRHHSFGPSIRWISIQPLCGEVSFDIARPIPLFTTPEN